MGVTAVHAALTAVMWWWVYTLATPPETFPTSRMYLGFERSWPYTESGWAWVFLVPSVVGIVGLLAPMRCRYLRLNLAAALALAHVLLAIKAREGNPAGTGWGIYVILAALGLWRLVAEGSIRWERV